MSGDTMVMLDDMAGAGVDPKRFAYDWVDMDS
jgi:hypothetical protein